MLEDCIRLLRAPFPADLPFLSVLGNHDVRGKGAREAYLAFARDFFTRQAGVEASYPSFSLRLEGDLLKSGVRLTLGRESTREDMEKAAENILRLILRID